MKISSAKMRKSPPIKGTQTHWHDMLGKQLSLPHDKKRTTPGAGGGGKYFRIVVRDKNQFTTFRNQDVGKPGHIQRLAGKDATGYWDTQAWLISKEDAHIEDDKLIPDSSDAKEVLDNIGLTPKRLEADIFTAKQIQDEHHSQSSRSHSGKQKQNAQNRWA